MKVIVSAGGRFHALHLAHQLNKKGHLNRLFTNSYTKMDKGYIPAQLVTNNKLLQTLDPLYHKLRLSKFISSSAWYVFKDNLFDKWVKNKIDPVKKVDIFVGWANYFLKSLDVIRDTGAKVILESGSAHILYMNKLLQREYSDLSIDIPPISKKNIIKMLKEYDAADYIMVPSQFVYDSFISEGISSKKLLKVPYGVDASKFTVYRDKPPKKFKVIFVGLVGINKGVHYLIKAWKKLNLNNAELIVVGNIDNNFYPLLKKLNIPSNIVFHGSVPQSKLINLYGKASVFVLPSIQEGLAMVQGEAMASGLPVI